MHHFLGFWYWNLEILMQLNHTSEYTRMHTHTYTQIHTHAHTHTRTCAQANTHKHTRILTWNIWLFEPMQTTVFARFKRVNKI